MIQLSNAHAIIVNNGEDVAPVLTLPYGRYERLRTSLACLPDTHQNHTVIGGKPLHKDEIAKVLVGCNQDATLALSARKHLVVRDSRGILSHPGNIVTKPP